MPKKLVRTGMQWEAAVDGHFPARITTNCDAIDNLLRDQAIQKNVALSQLVGAVETVCGKLTKHRRAKVEKSFVHVIATLAGESWKNGATAAQAGQGHSRSGGRYESRDAEIVDEIERLRSRPKPGLTIEQAVAEVADMNTPDGRPRFTHQCDGVERLESSAVLAIYYRARGARSPK